MFEVGQQVVCVTGDKDGLYTFTGEVYTVCGITPEGGLMFIEVESGSPFGSPWFWGHNPKRFRPLAKRSDTLTIESFLTIKPGFEEPKRRVVEPVKEGQGA